MLDRTDNRGRRRDHAAFPDPLDAQRVEWGGRDVADQLDLRQLGRGRQQVLGEIGADRLRGLVVDHPLEQRIADAMHDAAYDLAVDDHRVDLLAAVAHHHIAQDPYRARDRIDLDLHRVRGVAVGEARRHEVGSLLQTWLSRLQPLGQGIARDAGRLARNVAELDRHVAAPDAYESPV